MKRSDNSEAVKFIAGQISLFFLLVVTAYGAEKLDPFSADFAIIPDASKGLADIGVTLDFYIHNPGKGKLAGTKFVCMEEIDSVSVTDGEGRRLPFTIKQYPRKRIIWEYGPAKLGVRRVKISFIMRNAVKREGKDNLINLDWIGGWTRQVMNATFTTILPSQFLQDDIVSVSPKNYRFVTAPQGNKIIHDFPVLNAKTLKLVFKDKKSKDETKKSKKKISAKNVIKNIRVAYHDAATDRLVFDLNRKTPCDILPYPEKKEVHIFWKVPLEVSNKALQKKQFKSRLIKGLYWKKEGPNALTSIVQLRKKNLRIRYGKLPNPPRVYIDAVVETVQKKSDQKKPALKKEAEIKPAAKKITKAPQTAKLKKPVIKEKFLAPLKAAVTTTTSIAINKREAPIEERLAYNKAKKLYNSKDYINVIPAYEDVLRKFPETLFKEDMFFEIADSFFMLAESKDLKYYENAIQAYKKAMINFPKSAQTPPAAFQIADIHRKRGFYVEAKSKYESFIDSYPRHPLAIEARYWKAECLFQMYKFKKALKEFVEFIDDFPSGPHLKESTFRIAHCYYNLNDFDRAEYYYEKAIKQWPDLINLPLDTLNNMAMTYYYRGKFEKCRKICFLSFNLYAEQENRDRLLRYVGDSFQWDGEMQKALNIYGFLVSLFPDSYESMIAAMRLADLGVNVSGLESLPGFTFNNFNPYLEPAKTYRWVIENDKKGDLLTESYYKLGFILAKKGQYYNAVNFFKRSMHYQMKGLYYNKSIYNIKKILVEIIDDAMLKKDYFSVVDTYSRNEDAFLQSIEDCDFIYNVGRAYFELGFINKAETLFQGIIKKVGYSDCRPKSIVGLGRIDLIRGKTDRAEERLSILLYGRQAPSSVPQEARQVLADAFFQGKKYKEAVKIYSEVLKNEVESLSYAKRLYRFGESLGRVGYYYSGIETLKRFIVIADRMLPRKEELSSLKVDAGMLIGDFYFEKGNYNAAIDAYRALGETTADKDKKGWAFFKWAEALSKKGDNEGATKMFSRVAESMAYDFLGRFAQKRVEDLEWGQKVQPVLKELL